MPIACTDWPRREPPGRRRDVGTLRRGAGSWFGKGELAGLGEELVHGGLQFVRVHAALDEPLREGVKGGGGEKLGDAGHGQLGAGGAGADVVAGVAGGFELGKEFSEWGHGLG